MARWQIRSTDYRGRTHIHEAESLDAIRQLRAELVDDPDVESFTQPSLVHEPELVTNECPACGRPIDLAVKYIRRETCRCGLAHVTRSCNNTGCREVTVTPPFSDGCGPIPEDAQAQYDKRLHNTDQTKWRPIKNHRIPPT